MTLSIVQDAAADEVLAEHPFALLCAMVLTQDTTVEVAFAGPAAIWSRLGSLEPAAIADLSEEEFSAVCASEPPIHPFPDSMAVLIQALARHIVTRYEGDTATIWLTARTARELATRLVLLPGFSKRRTQIFVAFLGKQLDLSLEGWASVAGRYAEPDVFLSVADVRDSVSLERVNAARATRQLGDDEGTNPPDHASGPEQESRESTQMNESEGVTENAADAAAEVTAEERGNRRRKRKEAKQTRRAANRERRKAEEEANPELAAERGAKRAARREAKTAGAGKSKTDKGKGKGKGRKGRNRRRREDGSDSAVETAAGSGAAVQASGDVEVSTDPVDNRSGGSPSDE